MHKVRSFLIYLFTTMFAILLFASFEAEFYFSDSSLLNLNGRVLYYAFTNTTEELKQQEPETPAEEETKKQAYQKGDTSLYVRDYKLILYYMGRLSYPQDNSFDEALESAVLAYQQDKSLEVTGILNDATMTALDAEALTYEEEMRGDVIAGYQKTLIELKYFPEGTTASGTFDRATTDAVKSYQYKNGLEVTGKIDPATQTALSRELSEQTPSAE